MLEQWIMIFQLVTGEYLAEKVDPGLCQAAYAHVERARETKRDEDWPTVDLDDGRSQIRIVQVLCVIDQPTEVDIAVRPQ